jgi:4-hydroxy-tetrahydrodipicolinate reductase
MPNKIGITGITGNIGKELKLLITENKKLEYAGGISTKNITASDFSKLFINSDVVIDFSSSNLLDHLLENATKTKKPLVIGTTGYSENQIIKIIEASKIIPIFYSSNFSLGMHVVKKVLKTLTKELSNEYLINLIEWHRLDKKDLPSGTAKDLIKEILKYSDRKIETTSIRAGKTFCEHSIYFTDDAERVTVKHEVYDKKTFAKSAIDAALFILSQDIGYYKMDDLLGNLICSK